MVGSCYGIKKTAQFNFNSSDLDGRRWTFIFYFVDPSVIDPMTSLFHHHYEVNVNSENESVALTSLIS
jgi:hypothetical protein